MYSRLIKVSSRHGYLSAETALCTVMNRGARRLVRDSADHTNIEDKILSIATGVGRREGSATGREFILTFPKVLSYIVLLVDNERLTRRVRRWVWYAMALLERVLQLRQDRTSSNAAPEYILAGFAEVAARPVDGLSDMHLHAHIDVSTVAYVDNGRRLEPVDFQRALREWPSIQEKVVTAAAHDIIRYGIQARYNDGAWQVIGVDSSTLIKFSRRSTIEEAVQTEGRSTTKYASDKMALTDLRQQWWARLTDKEQKYMSFLQETVRVPHLPSYPAESLVLSHFSDAVAREYFVDVDLFAGDMARDWAGLVSEQRIRRIGRKLVSSHQTVASTNDRVLELAMNSGHMLSTSKHVAEYGAVCRAVRESHATRSAWVSEDLDQGGCLAQLLISL